jgi:hypothetical protein
LPLKCAHAVCVVWQATIANLSNPDGGKYLSNPSAFALENGALTKTEVLYVLVGSFDLRRDI